MSPKKFEEKYSKLTERDKKEAHQLRSGVEEQGIKK
jgi:hypothetical protein